ncbi:polysaccharide deacetylase family protein [Thalassomonas actiniarum]|uniref:Polysaccharide deacetylase family protein n=1 Tax=Thalassomonas actiniarum TaxID=485447 RepID=A0AAF0C3W5_9GAMM|nr:polysaccharide deacetylase family protein [Thalassomonas actiniarum]WDE01647.1 polysaccharide deacetylase family protein [Thalassomonas actiniarum]
MITLTTKTMDLNEVNVILHVDDIGMVQGGISAFAKLFRSGKIISGSLMAPCPWFALAVQLQQKLPEADLGLHLTLTSEWAGYRWGPVTPVAKNSGLTDTSGRYFHPCNLDVCEQASIETVTTELNGQIELAQNLGFVPSHLDGHMFTCQQAKFLPVLLDLALEHRIPAVFSRQQLNSLPAKVCHHWDKRLKQLGLPVFDSISRLPLNKGEQVVKAFFSHLPAGLHYLYAHPVKPGTELATITYQAQDRVAEYHALMNFDLGKLTASMNIKLRSFKTLDG